MPIDRDAALKEAEQLLRQGKLDGAIEAYVRLVEDRPSDWSSINALGDLCLRTGDVERAIVQFTRVADQFFSDGSLQKAAALYKKALRAQGDHEPALQQLGEIAVRQGITVDAGVYLQRLAEQRQRRGDDHGAVESLARLGALKEARIESRMAAATAAERDAAEGIVPGDAVSDALADDVAPRSEIHVSPEGERPIELEVSLEVELGDALDAFASAPADTVDAPFEPPVREQASEEHVVESVGVDVDALELAVRDAGTRFAAATALGRHHISQGDLRTGIQWLERAAEATAARQEEAFAALYELAGALESLGQSPRALAVLIDLDLDSGGYLDGRARIDRLMALQTRSDAS